MGVYRCPLCEEFIDNDYFPCEEINGELVCPKCAELDEEEDEDSSI